MKCLGAAICGDLWMWLQLMWLHFEAVRGPVGVVWAGFGAGLGPLWAPSRPQIDPKRRRPGLRQLNKFQPHYLPALSHTFYILNCGSGPENGHETALDLVSWADFGCVLHHFSSPTRWSGSRGQVRPETGQKTNKHYNLYYLY